MKNNTQFRKRPAVGEFTGMEYMGLDKERQYAIAEKGYVMMKTGNLDEAEQIFRALITADPNDSMFHCQLGAIYFRKQQYPEAFDQFEDSIRLNKANVDALAARGELSLMRQDYEAGIADLRLAVETDPEGRKQSSVRARAILLSLKKVVENRSGGTSVPHLSNGSRTQLG